MSYFSTTRIFDIAREAPKRCRKWVQVYLKNGADMRNAIRVVHEAESSGFEAVVVTIDAKNNGRQRYARRRSQEAKRQRRRLRRLQDRYPPANVPISEFDEPWTDSQMGVRILRHFMSTSGTRLPLIVKGILTTLDAATALEAGAAGLWISNHGGRFLDSEPASVTKHFLSCHSSCLIIKLQLDGGVE